MLSKKRRNIEFRDGPSDYCQVCMSMISADGLRKLASLTGFTHHERGSCEKRAEEGCPLCMIIVQNSANRWRSGQELIFFARLSRSLPRGNGDERGDETVGLRAFDELNGFTGLYPNLKYVIFLKVHTNAGEQLIRLPAFYFLYSSLSCFISINFLILSRS
jgi:hypothetical protein